MFTSCHVFLLRSFFLLVQVWDDFGNPLVFLSWSAQILALFCDEYSSFNGTSTVCGLMKVGCNNLHWDTSVLGGQTAVHSCVWKRFYVSPEDCGNDQESYRWSLHSCHCVWSRTCSTPTRKSRRFIWLPTFLGCFFPPSIPVEFSAGVHDLISNSVAYKQGHTHKSYLTELKFFVRVAMQHCIMV